MRITEHLRRWMAFSLPELLFLRLVALRTDLEAITIFPGAHPNVLESQDSLADGVIRFNALLQAAGSPTEPGRILSDDAIVIALRLINGQWVDPHHHRRDALDAVSLAAFWLAAAGRRVFLLGPVEENQPLNAALKSLGLQDVSLITRFDPELSPELASPVVAMTAEVLRHYALYSECQPLGAAPVAIAPDYVLVSDGWTYFKELLTLEAVSTGDAGDNKAWMQFCFDTAHALPNDLQANPAEATEPCMPGLWSKSDTGLELTPLGQSSALAFFQKATRFHEAHTEPEFLLLIEDALKAQHLYRLGTHYELTTQWPAPLPALKEGFSAAEAHFLLLQNHQSPPDHDDIAAAVAVCDVFGSDCCITGLLPYAHQFNGKLIKPLPIRVSTLHRAPPLHLECLLVKHAEGQSSLRSMRWPIPAKNTLSTVVDFGVIANFAFTHETHAVAVTIPASSALCHAMQRYSDKTLDARTPSPALQKALNHVLVEAPETNWQQAIGRHQWHQEIRRPLKLISSWRQTWLATYQHCLNGDTPLTHFELKAAVLEFCLSLDDPGLQQTLAEREEDEASPHLVDPTFQRIFDEELTAQELNALVMALAADAVRLIDQFRTDLLSQACVMVHAASLRGYAQQRPLHEFTRDVSAFMHAATARFKSELLMTFMRSAQKNHLDQGTLT